MSANLNLIIMKKSTIIIVHFIYWIIVFAGGASKVFSSEFIMSSENSSLLGAWAKENFGTIHSVYRTYYKHRAK